MLSYRTITQATLRSVVVWLVALGVSLTIGCATASRSDQGSERSATAAPSHSAADRVQPVYTPGDEDPPAKPDKPEPSRGKDERTTADKPTDDQDEKVRPSTEEQRQKLIELIKKQAEAARARQRAQQQKGTAPKKPPVPGKDAAKPGAKPETPTQRTAQRGKGGCGDKNQTNPNLTPPPEDQPQPKLVCEKAEVKDVEVWQGEKAVFKYVLANKGEAPLNVLLKGG